MWNFPEEISGFCEKLVVLRSSFSCARLDSVWSFWNGGGGNCSEESIKVCFALIAAVDAEEGGGPLAYGGNGSGEAETGDGTLFSFGGFEHERADKIVGNEVHGEFFFYKFWALTAQDIHSHCNLDVAQEELDAPALAIEVGNVLCRIGHGIHQGGGDREGLCSESWDWNRYLYVAHGEAIRQLVPEGLFQPLGPPRGGLKPFHDPIPLPDAFDPAPPFAALPSDPHEGVHAAPEQQSIIRKRTKSPIRQRDVSRGQQIPQAPPQRTLMVLKRPTRSAQQGTGGQGK